MNESTILPPGVEVRYTEPGDAKYLKAWLLEKDAIHWFPMCDVMEVEDAVLRWIAFYRFKCSITIVKDGVPCGIGTLYLQPYLRLVHQCEFGIIVGDGYRGQGIGSCLMNCLLHLAKEKFKIELIHLQVYNKNPAIDFYKRFGFKEFGRQNEWIKEETQYGGRVFMEKYL